MSQQVISISPVMIDPEGYLVPEELFGGILINKSDFYDFAQDYEDLGLTFVRFPGGAFSEVGVIVNGGVTFGEITSEDLSGDRSHIAYDLTFPELYNPELLAADAADPSRNTYASLSEAMALCVEQDTFLSIILPVERYFNGVDLTDPDQYDAMVAQVEADLMIFLDRLVSGEYNEGVYPEPIIFEIGNELYGSPIEYAIVAKVYIDLLEEVLGPFNIKYEIAFQMNNGSSQFQNLYNEEYFHQYFDSNGQSQIPGLEDFYFDPNASYNFGERVLLIEEITIEILGDSILSIDLLRHHYLTVDQNNLDNGLLEQRDDILQYWYDAIDELGGDILEVDYYISAWTTDSGNVGRMSAGMPAAANTLILLTEFLLMGVDIAAAWGLNGSRGYWPEDSPETVLTFSEEEGVTPSGAVLGMMAESTIGLEFVLTEQDRRIDSLDSDDYLEFIFTSTQETVLFYTAGDLSGTELVLEIDLSAFGYFGFATIDNLGTIDGTIEGLASIETSSQTLSDNTVTIAFDQDYEVVRIIVENLAIEGSESSDEITGTSATDYIFGNGGADVLNGWGGADHLFGGDGTDGIYGNAGSDIMYGGSGSDRLLGGNDADHLFGDGGDDLLEGQGGDDFIFGGLGADNLYGGSGNDTLQGGIPDFGSFPLLNSTVSLSLGDYWEQEVLDIFGPNLLQGGEGDDVLIGSRGVDTFIFEAGHDSIHGFEVGIDQVLIDVDGLTAAQALTQNILKIETTQDGLLLVFDESNTLAISGVYELSQLWG